MLGYGPGSCQCKREYTKVRWRLGRQAGRQAARQVRRHISMQAGSRQAGRQAGRQVPREFGVDVDGRQNDTSARN